MPVSSLHPAVTYSLPAYQLVRDAVAGSRAIKKQSTLYLPQLSGQEQGDYDVMQKRALWLGATKRALKAFSGFIFRNNPEFKHPAEIQYFMDDATMTGKSFYDYCKDVVNETIKVGRGGTLVEWDSPAAENRAYVMRYDAEDIINWRFTRTGGKTVMSLLVLHDSTTQPFTIRADVSDDEYEAEEFDQWKVYRLRAESGRPYVQVEIWEEEEPRKAGGVEQPSSGGNFKRVATYFPNRAGFPLSRIPFVFHNVDGDNPCPVEVPLEDMAEVNVSHYRTSADLENARHVCGVPTPFAAGFTLKDGETLTLGSSSAWVADNPQAKGGFIELSATGVLALENAIKEKEAQMAALGARMLEKQGGGSNVEAYQTVQIRQSGESSALMDITIACTQTLSKVLQWVSWWTTIGDDVIEDHAKSAFVELNTDFVASELDPSMLQALTAAYLSNAISEEDYFAKLQHGGIISSEVKLAEWQEAKARSQITLPEPDPKPGDDKKKKPADDEE